MRYFNVLGPASVLLVVGIAASACGSGDTSTFGDGTSNGTSGGPIDNVPLSNVKADSGAGPDELAACATEQRKATPLPLDLYIMLDTSGSMSTQVAQSVSKYKAVADALGAFVADTGSAGMGVGLQFFPLPVGGTPTSCTASAQCPGATGPCSVKACAQSGPLVFCDVKADCAGGANCISVGQCANAKNVYCGVGAACGPDGNGFDRGTCIAQSAGVCSAADSCADADYIAPAVAIDVLPTAAAGITAALAGKEPAGSTPTAAGLKGAVDGAQAYAAAHPGHTVVAVLATDGLPTECDTDMTNISAIAATAFTNTPSIKTFVIGVFAADEAATAQVNLDQIAAAGGTSKAFVVTQGATTTAQFIAAMNTIRGTALPCDYAVPVPESGTPDYDKMNVQHTAPAGQKTVLPNKKGASACDAAGGWYYDADPSAGGSPTKIVLCPTTCSDVKAKGGQIDVVVGCKTQVR